jgi:ATP-dependent Lon protease
MTIVSNYTRESGVRQIGAVARKVARKIAARATSNRVRMAVIGDGVKSARCMVSSSASTRWEAQTHNSCATP